jgi:hypothetical protein
MYLQQSAEDRIAERYVRAPFLRKRRNAIGEGKQTRVDRGCLIRLLIDYSYDELRMYYSYEVMSPFFASAEMKIREVA